MNKDEWSTYVVFMHWSGYLLCMLTVCYIAYRHLYVVRRCIETRRKARSECKSFMSAFELVRCSCCLSSLQPRSNKFVRHGGLVKMLDDHVSLAGRSMSKIGVVVWVDISWLSIKNALRITLQIWPSIDRFVDRLGRASYCYSTWYGHW